MFQHINAVGVELEGLWERDQLPKLRSVNANYHLDGSVSVDDDADKEPDGSGCDCGHCTGHCEENEVLCAYCQHRCRCGHQPAPVSEGDDDERCAFCIGECNEDDHEACNCPYCQEECEGRSSERGASRWQGEYVSPLLRSADEVKAFMEACHPAESNDSCGLHVHVSTKQPMDMGHLVSPEFYEKFEVWVAALPATCNASGKKLGVSMLTILERRMLGKEYCYRSKPGELSQARRCRGIDRYRQLNADAYTKHGTVEVRVLPMFDDQEHAWAAVKSLLDLVEAHLEEVHKQGKKKHHAMARATVDVEAPDDVGEIVLEEVTELCVS